MRKTKKIIINSNAKGKITGSGEIQIKNFSWQDVLDVFHELNTFLIQVFKMNFCSQIPRLFTRNGTNSFFY